MTDYIGKCPVCQAELKREGDNVVCPSGDYSILESIFLQAWDEYDVHKDAEVLLKKLLDQQNVT